MSDNVQDVTYSTGAELLCADPFESSFAIKWLMGFTSRSEHWITACHSDSESEERSDILDQAIILLSTFASVNALTRTFSLPFTASSNKKKIHVELNDAPLSKRRPYLCWVTKLG